MSTKYTPGPWRIGYPDGSGADPEGACITMESEDQRTTITVVRGGNPEGDLSYGVLEPEYARMIAAVPELLEALKRIVRELPTRRDWLDPVTEAFAKDAIKKAEGR